MHAPRPSAFRAFLPPTLALFLLAGCGPTTKSILLRSDLSENIPIGPARLPARNNGLSFQGTFSVQGNVYTSRELGKPDFESGLLNLATATDSSSIAGPILVHQDRTSFSGEGSVFLSPYVRIFGGLEGSSTGSAWGGIGFSSGPTPWSIEADATLGSLRRKRSEVWRIETREDCNPLDPSRTCTPLDTRDTAYDVAGSDHFTRLDFTLARTGGGPLLAYQWLDFPVTQAPNLDRYTESFHTIRAGFFQPFDLGTLSVFLQTTYLGKSWSPSFQLQYTADLGGRRRLVPPP